MGAWRGVRRVVDLFRDAFRSWDQDKAPRLGAALAYYTVFSIPPLLILLMGLASLVFGQEAVRARFVETIQSLVGLEGAAAVRDMLPSSRSSIQGILPTLLGMTTLVLGASGVFGHIKDALDTVWEVKPKPGHGLRAFLRKYVFSMALLLGTGFLLIVSLALSTALTALGDELARFLPGGAGVWEAVNAAVSIGVIAVLFGLMYRYIPDVHVAWRDALIGGLVTSLLFAVGENVIGFYLGKTNVGSAFGAAGSLVVVLVWIYYSSMIFFFGAEFTKVYSVAYGTRAVPEEGAARVTAEERAHQGLPTEAPPPARTG